MRECPDRLEADLTRFYGIDLDDLYSGRRSVRAVANAAAHFPRGGAVGEWFGGHVAVTAETEAMWELAHILAQVNSKKKIKPRPMPDGVRDAEKKRAHALARAKKYRARSS